MRCVCSKMRRVCAARRAPRAGVTRGGRPGDRPPFFSTPSTQHAYIYIYPFYPPSSPLSAPTAPFTLTCRLRARAAPFSRPPTTPAIPQLNLFSKEPARSRARAGVCRRKPVDRVETRISQTDRACAVLAQAVCCGGCACVRAVLGARGLSAGPGGAD